MLYDETLKVLHFALIEGRRQVVEWWGRADFHGCFNMVMGAEPVADPSQLTIIPVSDDCIISDFISDYCNADLQTFPIPVIAGSALCPECFNQWAR